MPEGDSIHKLAMRLRPIVGKPVTAFAARAMPDAETKSLVGRTVAEVEARGKNLLVRFDDGRSLHIHLRMNGRVSIVRKTLDASRTAYRRSLGYVPSATPQLRFEAGGWVVQGSRIPVLRLYASEASEARAPDLASLGPDLANPDFDEGEALARLAAERDRPIGVAIMMQRLFAGVGNVFKSEILFLEKLPPERRVGDFDPETLRRVVRRARDLLRANVKTATGPRTTRSSLRGERLWVYGRRGEPCFECGAPIKMIRQGAPPGRSTYYCPGCQATG